MLYGGNILNDDSISEECVPMGISMTEVVLPLEIWLSERLTKFVKFPCKPKCNLLSINVAVAFMENSNCTKPCFKITQKLGLRCLYVNAIKY